MAKYFENLEGLREVSHTSSFGCLFGSYLHWNLVGRQRREGPKESKSIWCSGRCIGCMPGASDAARRKVVTSTWAMDASDAMDEVRPMQFLSVS